MYGNVHWTIHTDKSRGKKRAPGLKRLHGIIVPRCTVFSTADNNNLVRYFPHNASLMIQTRRRHKTYENEATSKQNVQTTSDELCFEDKTYGKH